MYATLRAPLIVLSILILTTVAGGRFASAQAQGIEIQPAVIEGRIDPGNSYSYSVRVSNISDTEQTYYLSSQDISGLTDEGLPIFDDNTEKTPYELSSWITLSVDRKRRDDNLYFIANLLVEERTDGTVDDTASEDSFC
jgi:hypothetical protein